MVIHSPETYKLGNNDKETDALFELIRLGKKTATCALFNPQTTEGERYYVSNSDGSKKMLVEITKLETKKFCDISSEHARKEGEGDLSLEYWRETHTKFFTEELKKQSKEFNEDILLLCEDFIVIEELS